jgi:hypothetical protein
MKINHKQSIIFGAILALTILTFFGLILSTMPLHTSEADLNNQFVLDAPFKNVLQILQKNDIAHEALILNGDKILNEKVVYRKVGFEGKLRNWKYRQITQSDVNVKNTMLYLKNDINITPDSASVLVTLRQPNKRIGLMQLKQDIQVTPFGESQTLVVHQTLVSVSRKCPTRWHNYMDNYVKSSVQKNMQTIEYLLKKYVGE